MTLAPDSRELVARARADLRMGVGVVLTRADGSGALVLAAETLTAARLGDACGLGRPMVALTSRRAETLKARAYDGDLARVALPSDADLTWVRALADPAGDLNMPLKGPLKSLRDGDSDLARAGLRLCKQARLLPAALLVDCADAADLARRAMLTMLPAADVTRNADAGSPMLPVVHARLPMAVSEQGRLHVFRPEDGGEEHYAIEIGAPDRGKPVLARLHSACFTGDLMGSLKCDCGP
ncbi:MAG: GTP cyclohydrolase II, partial [Rhodobacteraceae bacterium]|nr:GTP cyclohydrolase II [Paracoccaceae bacterium]